MIDIRDKAAEEYAYSNGKYLPSDGVGFVVRTDAFKAGFDACLALMLEREKEFQCTVEKYINCKDEYQKQPYSADNYLYWRKEYDQRELEVREALEKLK